MCAGGGLAFQEAQGVQTQADPPTARPGSGHGPQVPGRHFPIVLSFLPSPHWIPSGHVLSVPVRICLELTNPSGPGLPVARGMGPCCVLVLRTVVTHSYASVLLKGEPAPSWKESQDSSTMKFPMFFDDSFKETNSSHFSTNSPAAARGKLSLRA